MLRLLTEHWELKIVAALVAFALWFFVATREHSQVGLAATGSATVVPQVHGTPASGYAVQRVLVEPSNVEIKGPRSTIETRGEVSTFPVDVSGSRGTVTQSVGLLLPASTYLTRERTVRVTVEIAEDGMAEPQGAHAARKRATAR
jgi:YbbR domain-containing protein